MLTLDLCTEPRWLELAPGLRLHLRPLTTALMVATQRDPALLALPDQTAPEERALVAAKVLARRAILDWEGVGDAAGKELPVSPEAIDALLDIWPIFEAFQIAYVSKGLLLDAEKNACAPLPNGTSAGARPTAPPAGQPVPTARQG
jgi:hypothetical protein